VFEISRGGDSPGRDMYNGYISAFDEDKNVAYIDYNMDTENKKAVVAMVFTDEEYRRQGIAEALLDSFVTENPDYEISPGGTTDEGGDWWRSVTGGDGPIKAEKATQTQEGLFSPRKGEQGDSGSRLSSGKKYQEIVDSQPSLSEDKKQSIANFLDDIVSEEFQKEDIYVLDTGPTPPRPPGMPEPKPRQILKDDEKRTLEKERVRNLLAEVFKGEMTLDKDVIITADDGTQLNIGKKVLVEIMPQSSYAPAIKVKKASEKDLAEQDELGLYEENIKEGDLVTELQLEFRIKPLPEYSDALLAIFNDEDGKRYISREDGTPALATGYRTFIQVSGDDKDVRIVSHDSFYINNRAQGQGIGSVFNARNEKLYNELDVRSIITWGNSGSGSTGAVHWPKNGFSWAGEKDKQDFIKLIDEAIVNTPEMFSEEDRKKISSLYRKNNDTGLFETEATAEEFVDFPKADEVFSNANAQFFYSRPLRELAGASSGSSGSARLSSGRAPRYPREPTLGAFLEGAQERFEGVDSWEEFKERYAETEMVFLDYETTGLDFDEFGKATTNGNPTQIGLVRMKNGKEIGRLNLFMNPEQPLGEWSLANLKDADGNPITNEWLATQMPMAEAHRQVAEFIGPDAIIGVQNATFDKRVLEDALERDGIDWRPSGYLDTRDISAMTLPVWSEESPEGPYITDRDGNKKPSSSLAAITEYLDVELGEGHHNADADAFATSQVMQKIIDRAIENGWSTDVLDKEKRDAKLKADNDKFNADIEKFESDKESFVSAQKEEESTRLSSGARAKRSIPPISEIRKEVGRFYRESEMSDADVVRTYLQIRNRDAEELYESRHTSGREISDEIGEHFSRFRDFIDNERISIDGMSDSEILEILKKGKYRSTIDSYDNAIDNIGPVPSKNSNRLSSGRQRELIPMNAPSKERKGTGATGYRTQDSSGNLISRYSSTWLSGLSSDEISKVVVPVNADEHFEMWADDIAGPNWRASKKQQKFIKNYYEELQKDSTNIPVDYSPESIAATQKLVKDLLDSSPSVMWVMQNFGAPLIVPFTREGMDAYENSPDMKERLELLAKQRGTEKIPFVSGLANRSLGSIGISPRALIDRESLLNDDKGVYPISLDPDRVPAPRDAHIDRSLEGTLVHEFGHWIHHRALWDTETNGASGKMRSYYGTGKLSDPRYVASLDVAEEYGDYETDDKRIEIYSQFIDLTGRSPEEMFRAHPDEPLLSTSYGNINKREAMAEAFVAIMHPNKEMPEKTLSKKLRKDIYTLIGVDEKNLPWSDSKAGSENRLSSGAKKDKRKTIFSRFRKEETEEATVEEKRKPPVVERPEGLVSFATEPSEELLKALPIPDEDTLKNELLKDVQSIALEFDKGAYGSIDSIGMGSRASIIAKKAITANLSRSVDFDVEDFIKVFSAGNDRFGFHSTETFKAVQKMYETVKNLPADAASTERRTAARGAFDTKSGRIISAKIHDDILGRARYYDEILDRLEKENFDELFGSSFDELMATDGSEKSLFTPYLMTKLGTDDIRREFLEEIEPRRGLLNRLIEAVELQESKAFGLARIGEINPNTGERDYEVISLLGRGVNMGVMDAMSSLDISDEDYGQKFADIMSEFKGWLTAEKLMKIRDSGLLKIDSSNIDSPEIKKALKEHLVANVRSRAGNFESKRESYTNKTGVVFFDLETTEGKRLVRESLISDLIHTWAISANNANPVALAVQHEIRKMFGLTEAVGWSTWPLKALLPEEREEMSAHEFDGAPELTDAQSAMIRPILQNIYDATQLYYKTKGVTHVPIYRGFSQNNIDLTPGVISPIETTMRPLSSWSTSSGVALGFSNSGGEVGGPLEPTLLKAFVPVEDIFSHPLSGFGCLSEDEVVVIGKPVKAFAILAYDSEEATRARNRLKNASMSAIAGEGRASKLTTSNIEELIKPGSDLSFIDGSDLDIEDADLRSADLTEANLSGASLVGSNLSGANLTNAKLNNANLSDSNLIGADLSRADLRGANLGGADLSGADLTGANLIDADLSNANLEGARLENVRLGSVDLSGTNLTDADLTGANGHNINLSGADLTNANFTAGFLMNANLTDTNLSGTELSSANLMGAKLNKANLTGANLSSADMADTDLTRANLSGANLSGADLRIANLTEVDLTGADLTGADLTQANLTGANLEAANLTGANLTDAIMPEGYVTADNQSSESVQKLSSGKKSHTPEWKTVEEIVDFEVLGASPDDSEEDRDDIVKESVGGDWMQWDPCREIRTAAYELAGIDEYSERDPNITQSGGFFGNSRFDTAISPEKRTEQARYLMASIVDSLTNKARYEKQPYLYRAMAFSSPEEGKQFFDTMKVGNQVDIPLLAFVEIGPSPSGDHFLTRFGNDALLVLEDFPGSYQTGGTFEPVFSSRYESDTLYNVNEFAEAILADIENGVSDEENIENDTEFANRLIKLVDDYQKSRDPAERRQLKTDIKDTLDEVGNETIKLEWEGESLPEDHEDYYLAMEDEETGMTPREYVSGGRLEVVSVNPDPTKTYKEIITLRQVGAFDPQEKGALVLKTDGENSTRLSSGKNPSKKAKPKSVQLHDDEFEKKFNQKVPDGEGDCFSEAIQQARKLADAYENVKIVHGYPLGTGGEAEGLRFPHAWTEFERDGLVWVRDYSNGNRVEFPQILYYGIGNIEEADVSRYDIKEAEANMIENEHYGPW
jgi:uncharacterized protein YjbI with pentapeptide repeats/DNA polymerase III epsilon subunit-like protein